MDIDIFLFANFWAKKASLHQKVLHFNVIWTQLKLTKTEVDHSKLDSTQLIVGLVDLPSSLSYTYLSVFLPLFYLVSCFFSRFAIFPPPP